jgi:hypothetical protein
VKQSVTFRKNRSWGDEVDLHPSNTTTKHIKVATDNAKGSSLEEDRSIVNYSTVDNEKESVAETNRDFGVAYILDYHNGINAMSLRHPCLLIFDQIHNKKPACERRLL